MIEVLIRLHSAVDSSRDKTLGRAFIYNNGTQTAETNGSLGDYTCTILKGPHYTTARKVSTVHNFKRKQEDTWKLLYLSLKEIYEPSE